MPATERGIYHNLRESNYTASNGEVVFFFSSMQYLHKFLDRYHKNRGFFNDRFAKIVVDNCLNTDMLADLTLYMSLEIRGFYVWIKGVESTCLETHTYALEKATEKSTQDWSRIQKPKLDERRKIMESTYQVK